MSVQAMDRAALVLKGCAVRLRGGRATAAGASGLDFDSILQGLGVDCKRVLGGLGKDFRAFWVILGYFGLLWVIGVFLAEFHKIFADAPCCLLLLSRRLTSKWFLLLLVVVFLAHAFAP